MKITKQSYLGKFVPVFVRSRFNLLYLLEPGWKCPSVPPLCLTGLFPADKHRPPRHRLWSTAGSQTRTLGPFQNKTPQSCIYIILYYKDR